ncbi:hypothetical protein IB211_01964c [Intestinimonas butyriciproducens]|uniref:Uncharacterized protein n=1 Tax=Intestinimonas butyriciproducens TaxID=1297617 RepID=A0A0S2W4X9_9FIRM|nr:hypothetical protein IB211_01964c [Intestinimonas butyriciproducens]
MLFQNCAVLLKVMEKYLPHDGIATQWQYRRAADLSYMYLVCMFHIQTLIPI